MLFNIQKYAMLIVVIEAIDFLQEFFSRKSQSVTSLAKKLNNKENNPSH